MRRRDDRVRYSLFSIRGYIGFFALISFVCTCSFLLFYGIQDRYSGNLRLSALLTFFNILFLTILICLFDGVRRRVTIERPVRKIVEATGRLTDGDFSVRIEPLHFLGRENEFDLIIDDLNKMAEELSGIETLRTDFIANVSHEIKTPLAIIQNYATQLQADDLTPEQRWEYAAALTDAIDRLSDLVTNILKMNKLENQEIFPDKTEFNLGEQLRYCALQFEAVWERKAIRFEADIDDMTIRCDGSLLELVWNNLLSNAFKFTDGGGTVSVSLKKTPGWAVARISDTGCGIELASGTRIFDKFYQGDTSHALEGNGLGLALVKKVIDIVDGEISVESVVGEGSTFTVRLPR